MLLSLLGKFDDVNMKFSMYYTVFYVSYIRVIVLDDIAYGPDSREVFVNALRTNVMQRLRRLGIPVGACEVYSHLPKRSINITDADIISLISELII